MRRPGFLALAAYSLTVGCALSPSPPTDWNLFILDASDDPDATHLERWTPTYGQVDTALSRLQSELDRRVLGREPLPLNGRGSLLNNTRIELPTYAIQAMGTVAVPPSGRSKRQVEMHGDCNLRRGERDWHWVHLGGGDCYFWAVYDVREDKVLSFRFNGPNNYRIGWDYTRP